MSLLTKSYLRLQFMVPYGLLLLAVRASDKLQWVFDMDGVVFHRFHGRPLFALGLAHVPYSRVGIALIAYRLRCQPLASFFPLSALLAAMPSVRPTICGLSVFMYRILYGSSFVVVRVAFCILIAWRWSP